MQKLQSMFKIKEIMKMTNEAMAETIKDKDLNLTEIKHLMQQCLLQKK